MKRTVFVISGGEIREPSFLKARLASAERSEIICADGGARHLHRLGLVPGVIIGDMDSLAGELRHYFEEMGTRFFCYAERKDKTDTQLALEYAFTLSPEAIHIFAATGGRLDHTLANISLLAADAGRGFDIRLIAEWGELFLVREKFVLDGTAGQTVSFFPLTTSVEGIVLEGFEYPMTGGMMQIGYPIGVSNRLVAGRGLITVESGALLGIRYYNPGIFPMMGQNE